MVNCNLRCIYICKFYIYKYMYLLYIYMVYIARRRIYIVWKGKGIIYGEAKPRRILFPSLSNPYPPPCYHISDM